MLHNAPILKSIKDMLINDTSVLDYYWVHYFITGERSSVEKIIEAVGPVLSSEEVKEISRLPYPSTDKRIIGHAAISSLQSNANRYPEVLRIVEEGVLKPLAPKVKDTLVAAISIIHTSNEFSVPLESTYKLPKFGEIILKSKIDVSWKRGHDYPPQLDPEEFHKTSGVLRSLMRFIQSDKGWKQPHSLHRTLDAAKVYIAAYNLDLPEALELDNKGRLKEIRAQHYLKAALKVAPDDTVANKLAGVFFTQTGNYLSTLRIC
jgi:hypothetical protein